MAKSKLSASSKLVRKRGFEKPLKRIFNNLQSAGTLSLVAKTL